MRSQSIFFVNSTHKTKSWWMFLSVLLFVFIPFLIVWLLVGEFNLLHNDWLIAKGTSVWHGLVQADQTWIQNMVHTYGKFHLNGETGLLLDLELYKGDGIMHSIDSYFTFFNPIILAPLLGLLAWSFAYPIICNATKISGLDILPFGFGIGMFMFSTIITGLMNQWGQNLLAVYWLVRIVIAAAVTIVIFILTNYCVNKYIAGRPYAVDMYFGYKSIDATNAPTKEQLKENIDTFKHQSDQDDSFVEIEKGE